MTVVTFIALAVALAAIACLPMASSLWRDLQSPNRNDSGNGAKTWPRHASIAFLCTMPVAAGFIYFTVGEPAGLRPMQSPEPSITEIEGAEVIASLPPEERAQAVESMVAGLEARLRDEPNDLDGWRMLARSQSVLEAHERSAAAWREAIRLSNGAAGDWRGLAVALLENGGGNETSVSEDLENALHKVLDANQNDPMALFFLGVAARNKADNETARKHWTQLREQLPDDAPITARLNEMIASVE